MLLPPRPLQPATRRQALALGLAGAAGMACGPSAAPGRAQAQAERGAGTCLVMPEQTEGPFYFDPKLVRRDIAEGRPGVPIRLALQVVDAACQPIKNARVDVWHTDAQGLYSGYPGQAERGVDTRGQTFMRGTQLADTEGKVLFNSIYPGWYPGRTNHIHLKVLLDQKTALTSQLYFPDTLNDRIYDTASAYRRPRRRDTTNASDGIAGRGGAAAMAEVKEEAGGAYVVSLRIGVDPRTA